MKIGIIVMSGLFGPNQFDKDSKKKAFRLGVPVVPLDIYESKIFDNKTSIVHPKVSRLFEGSGEQISQKIIEIATSFKEQSLFRLLRQKIAYIREKYDSEQICILATSFSSCVAIRYMQETQDDRIDKIFAWYPHLIYPDTTGVLKNDDTIKPINFSKIPIKCSISFFMGKGDTINDDAALTYAISLEKSYSNIRTYRFNKAPHGFAERFFGIIPNLRFYWFNNAARSAYKESWRIVENYLNKKI